MFVKDFTKISGNTGFIIPSDGFRNVLCSVYVQYSTVIHKYELFEKEAIESSCAPPFRDKIIFATVLSSYFSCSAIDNYVVNC